MMKNEPSANNSMWATAREMLVHLGKIIIHNWPMKLACIVMAILLWGTLISRDETLTRTKVFENVTVNVTNEAAMQRNGFIVVGGLEQVSNVRITAEVPQNNYESATVANYNVRVDLSSVSEAGVITVPVTHTRNAVYGAVTDVSVKEVTLQVEEYVTRTRIPVKIRIEGELPDGLYGSASNIMVDPEYLTVAGPKSKVENVVRCVAVYDLSALSRDAGVERTACRFVLENAAGKAVDMENVSVTLNGSEVDSIVAEQTLYKTVTLKLEPQKLLKGEVKEGYRIKNVTVSPENIVMAVRDVSSFTGDLQYLNGAVDVTGHTESMTQVLSVIRPGDVINMNSDVAYVTVEIEKIEDSEGTK